MKPMLHARGAGCRPGGLILLVGLVLSLLVSGSSFAQESMKRSWGLGWDNGVTIRGWVAGHWEIGISAGPDDYLSKEETRSWLINDPTAHQGLLEVPEDLREEHGWVRFQVGRLIKNHGDFAVVGYGGLQYEWIVHQERNLVLDDLNSGYDTFELDRHTQRWVMTLGMRPSWQVTSFLTVETAFGLNFIVDNWDQTTNVQWSGVEGSDYQELDGHGQRFQDFGLEGAASIQIFIWL